MIIQGNEIEISTSGGTTGQTLIHDGKRFTPSSVLTGLKSLVTNRANIVKLDGSRVYYDNYALAQNASVAGDTIIVPSNIADASLPPNGEQITIGPNVSIQTLGFQLGYDNYAADGITFRNTTGSPSRGYFQGGNSVVYVNQTTTSGAWGMGTYSNSNNLFYDIYELRFKTTSTSSSSTILLNSPNSIFNFFNCNIEHSANGRIISAYSSSTNMTINFYNCSIKALCTVTGAANIEALNATSNINFYNCNFDISGLTSFMTNAGATISFYGCSIDARNRTLTTQFIGNTTKIGNIKLINTSVISNTTANFAIQCDTLILEGSTTIVGALSTNTTTDNRQMALTRTYADNASAITGGLKVGQGYKTATGEVRIVV